MSDIMNEITAAKKPSQKSTERSEAALNNCYIVDMIKYSVYYIVIVQINFENGQVSQLHLTQFGSK